jgi:superfamily II DNA or RNA helicase
MIQTVMVHPEIDWTGVGGVIVDECHHIAAEAFSTVMRHLGAPYVLGLSATPERKDGLSKVVHWFLGPLAYASQRKDMSHVVVEVIKYDCPDYRIPPPMTRFGTVDYPGAMTQLVDDRARTAFLVDLVTRIRTDDPLRNILVLSHRRDHCTALAAAIPGAATFLGGGSGSSRKKKTDQGTAPVVCATFAIASEGYDDARLDTLVLATPCSDVVQAAGRILRGTSAAAPRIYDIVDLWGVAYAMSSKRQAYYKKAGFRIRYTSAAPTKPRIPLGQGRCLIIDYVINFI